MRTPWLAALLVACAWSTATLAPQNLSASTTDSKPRASGMRTKASYGTPPVSTPKRDETGRHLMGCTSGSFNVSPCTGQASAGSYTTATIGFVFTNNSNQNVAAAFGCEATAPITSCSVSPTTATVRFGDSRNVVVTYTTGRGPSSFTSTSLSVSGMSVTATMQVAVAEPPLYVSKSGYSPLTRAAHSTAVDTFQVKNNSAAAATVGLSVSCGTPVVCALTDPSTASISLNSGASRLITVSSTAGEVGTSGSVYLTAVNGALSAPMNRDSASVLVNAPYSPTIRATSHNGEHRAPSLCAVGCFDVEAAYSTPAYTSLDVDRAITLWYSSAQASPLGTVQLDMADGSMPSPEKVSIRLVRAGGTAVDLLNPGLQELFYTYPTSSAPYVRLGAQFDASSLSTGAYSYTAELASFWTWAGTPVRKSANAPVSVLVLNESASRYGAGWSIAGLQRLYVDSAPRIVVATDGSGEIVQFISANGGSSYSSAAGDFSTLVKRVTSADSALYDRRYPDGTTYSFLPDGRLRYVKDRFGNTTSLGYAGTMQLEVITDPTGKALSLAYDGAGNLATVTDPGGRVTRFVVNAVTHNLDSIVDPTGAVVFRGIYDSRHRLLEQVDRAGGSWRFAYDFAGKLASDSTPAVTVGASPVRIGTRYRSTEAASLVDTARGPGGTLVGSAGAPSAAVYADSIRATVILATGDSTRFGVDRFGAPLVVEQPSLKTVATVARNAQGQPTVARTRVRTRTVDSLMYTWDGPRLTQEYDAMSGALANYTYDQTFSLLTLVTGSGGQVRFYLDPNTHSRVDSARAGPCCTTPLARFKYDAHGRVVRAADPRGDTTVIAYDSVGFQNTLTVTSGNRVKRLKYDAYGRVARSTNPRGDTVVVQRDSLNRIRRVSQPYAATTTFAYDSLNLHVVTDPMGQSYQFDHNALGWLEQRTDANTTASLMNRRDRHAFTVLGDDSVWMNRRQQETRTTYDAQGDVRSIVLSDGSTTTFSYDTAGYFAADSSREAIDTVRSDTTVRVLTEVTVRNGRYYAVRATSDAGGLLRTLALRVEADTGAAVRSTSFGYDVLQRLDSIRVNGGSPARIAYDDDDQITQITFPTGDSAIYSYSAQHQPYRILYRRGTSSTLDGAFGARFGQDTLNRLVQRSGASGNPGTTYAYDSLGRLVSVKKYSQPGAICVTDPSAMDGERCMSQSPVLASQDTFAYDLVGNRVGAGVATDPGNRLRTYAGFTLGYDDDGNLTSKVAPASGFSQSLAWNSINQLTSVTTNGTTVFFGYDGRGRRVRKSTPQGTTYFIYFGAQVVAEVDSATGALQSTYSYYPGVDAPHSLQRGSSTYYYVRDAGVGSVLGLIDGASNIVNRYTYAPFGALVDSTEGVPNSLRFAGREYDVETRLYYNRARYYDPQLGRFISEDPIDLGGGINLYEYAGGDPANANDPFGTCKTVYEGSGRFAHEYGAGQRFSDPDMGAYRCGRDGNTWIREGDFDPTCSANTGCSMGGGGREPSEADMHPQQSSQSKSCPFTLTAAEMRAARDAYRRTARAGRELVTLVVNGEVLRTHVDGSSKVNFWGATLYVGTTALTHGHLQVKNYRAGMVSPLDSTEAYYWGFKYISQSRDSTSMVAPGTSRMACLTSTVGITK